MCRGDSGIARRPTGWCGWDVEDAVPYDFVKSSTERVGAGPPDGPPMPKASEKPPLCGGGNAGYGVPYGVCGPGRREIHAICNNVTNNPLTWWVKHDML